MIFKVHKPTSRVGQFVELIWYTDVKGMFSGNVKILPDGSVQIIINLGPTQYLVTEDSKRGFNEGWITGQRTRPINVEISSDYKAIGIRFKPNGVFPFLKSLVSELKDEVIKLEDIWSNKFSLLREKLSEMSGVNEKFLIVEQFLLDFFHESDEPHAAIEYATRLLQQPFSDLNIRDVASKMGISHKHFIRLFKKHVGLNPKLYQQIFRFQHVLSELDNFDGDFSKMVARTNYYDQSHFNREFKKFTGITPNKYLFLTKADTHSLILD